MGFIAKLGNANAQRTAGTSTAIPVLSSIPRVSVSEVDAMLPDLCRGKEVPNVLVRRSLGKSNHLHDQVPLSRVPNRSLVSDLPYRGSNMGMHSQYVCVIRREGSRCDQKGRTSANTAARVTFHWAHTCAWLPLIGRQPYGPRQPSS